MSAEVLQEVRARLDGLVEVEARNRAGRARHESVAHRQHHRRAVVGLDQARGDDTHDALHPARVVDHRALELFHRGVALDVVVRLLRHGAVDRLAVLVVGVDDVAELLGDAFVALDEQLYGRMSARGRGVLVVLVHPHPSGGVDPRADLEYDVVDGDVVLVQSADLDDRQQPLRRFAVEVLQPEVGQDAVLAHERHDVRGDRHDEQVQQVQDLLEGDAVALRIGLHELEAHAAARQFVERVGAIDPLGVQNGYGAGNLLGREVVVADDEIHALRLRIDNLFRGFDAAVQGDDEPHALAGREVDPFDRNAVTFGIAVGNVEHQVFVPDLAQELVNQCDGRAAVHVVVAVNHDLLVVAHGALDPLDRLVHVLHQERIVEVREVGFKELVRLFYGVYASLYE